MNVQQLFIEIGVILSATFVVFKLFRSKIDPIKRLTTWFVAFFVVIGGVGIANRYILEAGIFPEQWSHLPLQTFATAILILYVPIREDKPEENEVKRADAESERGKKAAGKSKRRFKKK